MRGESRQVPGGGHDEVRGGGGFIGEGRGEGVHSRLVDLQMELQAPRRTADPERLNRVAVAGGQERRPSGQVHGVAVPVQDAHASGDVGEQRIGTRGRGSSYVTPADLRSRTRAGPATRRLREELGPEADAEHGYLRFQRRPQQGQLRRTAEKVLVRRRGPAHHHQGGGITERVGHRIPRPGPACPHRQPGCLQRRADDVRAFLRRVFDDQDVRSGSRAHSVPPVTSMRGSRRPRGSR